jgi:hypothetical protein
MVNLSCAIAYNMKSNCHTAQRCQNQIYMYITDIYLPIISTFKNSGSIRSYICGWKHSTILLYIALQHIYLDEQYIFNESKRLYIVGIKFQFNHSMYVGIEAYTDTVILEDLHLYAYFIRLQHSSFNYIYLHFMI